MARQPIENNSIHGMSLLVGELKGAIEAVTRTVDHLSNNWKMKDDAATKARDALADKVDDLRGDVQDVKIDVHEVKNSVESVQQDVAEMKNEMDRAQTAIADYEKNKPLTVAVIGDVQQLKEYVQTFQRKEQRALGWLDAIKTIGPVAWAIIGSAGTAGLGLMIYWLQKHI